MDEPVESDPAPEAAPARAPLPQWWWDLSVRDRRRVAGGLAAALVILVAVGAGWLLGRDGGEQTVAEQAAEYVAAMDPEQVAVWDRLAVCESEGVWDLDSGNGYFGGLQFSQTSWQGVGGFGNPAHATREEQIMRAEALFELQGWGAWPRCSSQLGYS